MKSELTSEQITQSMEAVAALIGSIAANASHIAHARRVLFEAYMSEGFNEAQALELCKALLLT